MIEDVLVGNEVYFQLARFFLTFFVGLVVTKMAFVPLVGKIVSKKGDKKAVHSFKNLAVIVGGFISFTLALQAADFGSLVTVLGTIAAAATVAVGFGMRDQVSSVVAGIFIHMDNPFLKGDYIKIKEYEGVVSTINLRATVLNGKNNEKQVVPNNILTGDVLKNYTKGNKTKVSIEFKINSEDLEKDEEEINKISRDMKETISQPKPEFKLKSIEKNEIITEASFWIKDSEDVKDVKNKFLRRFAEYRAKNPVSKDEKEKE